MTPAQAGGSPGCRCAPSGLRGLRVRLRFAPLICDNVSLITLCSLLLTARCAWSISRISLAHRGGASRGDPEGGARRGVPGAVGYRAAGGPRDPLLRVTMTRAANKVAARSRRECRTTARTGPGRKSPRWSAARRASPSLGTRGASTRRLRAGHGTRTRMPRTHPMRLPALPTSSIGVGKRKCSAQRAEGDKEREEDEVGDEKVTNSS